MGGGRHASDLALERYCFGSIQDEAQLKALVNHLAKCRRCEHRFVETFEIVQIARAAVAMSRIPERPAARNPPPEPTSPLSPVSLRVSGQG